jgi:hypothetical protein
MLGSGVLSQLHFQVRTGGSSDAEEPLALSGLILGLKSRLQPVSLLESRLQPVSKKIGLLTSYFFLPLVHNTDSKAIRALIRLRVHRLSQSVEPFALREFWSLKGGT